MHPSLFAIGPLKFHTYGLFVALGILAAFWYLTKRAAGIGMSRESMTDLVLAVTISGFFGARLLYVIYEFDYFKKAPLEIFAIWNGGIIFYGGLLGGLLGFVFFSRTTDLPALKALDLLMPAGALAQGFGRIGCFFNGCCYGKETSSPLGIVFPFDISPLHPTQLYESAFCFLLAGFLAFFYSRNKDKAGATSFLYFTLYPAGRFVIEFFRNDMSRLSFGLTLGQWMSAGVFLLTASVFLVRRVRRYAC